MEDVECMVCFSQYNDKQRPRSLPCGHTICSKCLEKAIAEDSKRCPKCRAHYLAANVGDIPINFSLETVVKLLNTLKRARLTECVEHQLTVKRPRLTECVEHQLPVKRAKLTEFVEHQLPESHSCSAETKADKLHECPEHHLPLSFRCSAHKSWICENCLLEDHSSDSCNIISINEELSNKKSRQLNRSQTFLQIFEKSCNTAEDCQTQGKKLIEEYEVDIIRYATMITRLQSEIEKKKNARIQVEEKCANFKKNLDLLKGKKSSYDQAVMSLLSSESIRELSQCSIHVQNEAEKLQSVSLDIDNEVNLMLKAFKLKADHLLGFNELTIRNGRPHLHVLRNIDSYESSLSKLQYTDGNYLPVIDGILTFLDIAWPGKEPQRVYMKMIGNTARARQHLFMVTYRGLVFNRLNNKGLPGEFLMIKEYDGDRAAPLLKDVTVTGVINHKCKAGLMTGVTYTGDDKANNALFGVYLKDDPGVYTTTAFGQVTSGLKILQEVAMSDERNKIKIVDCGVVLPW